ncbi:hypothetical protein MES4922_20029 [Mesorhizobium ventifaucium]|uniref:Uncharacterized protein n=1 Tax=Mesorhizobium ventifaucium TaxID=666020 RepID=A0ABN8JL09_9HYPH|nr:hypothetical protein MES4922_20029 [Mesorhizobium ventifaucium]
MVGKIVDENFPLPVTVRGEDAGRQVRGSANVSKRNHTRNSDKFT